MPQEGYVHLAAPVFGRPTIGLQHCHNHSGYRWALAMPTIYFWVVISHRSPHVIVSNVQGSGHVSTTCFGAFGGQIGFQRFLLSVKTEVSALQLHCVLQWCVVLADSNKNVSLRENGLA